MASIERSTASIKATRPVPGLDLLVHRSCNTWAYIEVVLLWPIKRSTLAVMVVDYQTFKGRATRQRRTKANPCGGNATSKIIPRFSLTLPPWQLYTMCDRTWPHIPMCHDVLLPHGSAILKKYSSSLHGSSRYISKINPVTFPGSTNQEITVVLATILRNN
jgi:hypothetical protein